MEKVKVRDSAPERQMGRTRPQEREGVAQSSPSLAVEELKFNAGLC